MIIIIRAFFQLQLVALLVAKEQHLRSCAKQHTDATKTSTTSHPLPLTILCPWDYPPVYIGIYRL